MNIFFIVTGVGLGDSTRIHAVIEALLKRHPHAKVMVAGYDNSYDYFKGKYPVVKIAGYRIPGENMRFRLLPFVFKNYLLPFMWFFIALKLRKKVKQFKPDVIISDFEPSGIALAKLIGKKCVTLFGFDPRLYEKFKKEKKVSFLMKMQASYLQKVYNRSDYAVIPSFVRYEHKSRNYTYVDPIVRERPDKLPSEEHLMKELKLERKPVVVMLGGSNFGTSLAKSLAKVVHDFNECFVVFGSGFSLPPQPNLIHHTFSPDFLKYLKVAKCVVTLGGQKTLCEGVVYKKPMLIYPIKEHVEQQLNAYALKDVALIGDELSPEAFKKKIEELLSRSPELEKKVKKLNFNGKGAEEVLWFVEGLVQ